jgi:hypothetical protein
MFRYRNFENIMLYVEEELRRTGYIFCFFCYPSSQKLVGNAERAHHARGNWNFTPWRTVSVDVAVE